MEAGYVLRESFGDQYWTGLGWANTATKALIFPKQSLARDEAMRVARRLAWEVVDVWDLGVEACLEVGAAA